MSTAPATTAAVGVIVAFDDAVGLGELATASGATLPFHCTSIADGTRTIAIGARVRFVERSKLGRTEAAAVAPV